MSNINHRGNGSGGGKRLFGSSSDVNVDDDVDTRRCDDDDDHPYMTRAGSQFRTIYFLPWWRYRTFASALLIIEWITVIVLWLVGCQDNDDLISDITNYEVLHSIIDVVIVTTVKCVLMLICHLLLEKTVMKEADDPYCRELMERRSVVHTILLLLSTLSSLLVWGKSSWILSQILTVQSFILMKLLWNVILIVTSSFSLIHLILTALSYKFMRRIRMIRIMRRLNRQGEEVDETGKPIIKPATLRRVVRYAGKEVGIISLGTVGLVVHSGAQMVAPLFFGKVVDAAGKSMDELNRLTIILLIIYLAGSVGSFFRSWLFNLAGQRVVATLRRHLFSSVIQQEVGFYDANRTGELLNRLSSDTQLIQSATTTSIAMLIRYSVQVVGSLVLMFTLSPPLTGVLLGVVPVVSLTTMRYGKYVKRLRQNFQDELANAGITAEECFGNIRTVRMFAGEEKSIRSYDTNILGSYNVGKKMSFIIGSYDGAVGVMSFGGITLVLWFGGKLLYDNNHGINTGVTPGVLTSFLLYTLTVAMAFAFLSQLYGDFMQAVGASVRIFELLDRRPLVPCAGGKRHSSLDGVVEFENVHFNYPTRPDTPVLKNISFYVPSGHVIALVGPSGGGKSTIVNLIERFYDPDRGVIYLGGHRLRDLDPNWFRREISMVGQEPVLFAGNILDNICYGIEPRPSHSEVERVARQANAHNFITGFDDGYDTVVGERGVRLSGGQKQRIAIARALITNPTVLLLDEATSALDAESEQLVHDAIDRALGGRTVIIIAHRLSTVINAHQVLVIDEGKLVEQGTHHELVDMDGVYKRLILHQLMAGTSRVTSGQVGQLERVDIGEDGGGNQDHEKSVEIEKL